MEILAQVEIPFNYSNVSVFNWNMHMQFNSLLHFISILKDIGHQYHN